MYRQLMFMAVIMVMFETALSALSDYGFKEGDKVQFRCGFVYTMEGGRWVYFTNGKHIYSNDWATVLNEADGGGITVQYRGGEKVKIQGKGDELFDNFVVPAGIIELIPYEV